MPPAARTATSRKRDSVPPNPTPDPRVLLRGLEAVRDGDREMCREAGASDDLAEPVNTDPLLSARRSWLHR